MKAYSIFDDFPKSSIAILGEGGVTVDLLPKGQERPSGVALKELIEHYDIIFISTGQHITEEMLKDVVTPKIIGTASSGTDHIHIPSDKVGLVRVANATHANRSTVAEHTFALVLTLCKKLIEGRRTAFNGLSKKEMSGKPIDLMGATMGVIGAGGVAGSVLKMAKCFGMNCLCWTIHPERHSDLKTEGVEFVEIDALLKRSDIVSVNIPLSDLSRNLISAERVELLKDNAVFVTTSRIEVTDKKALFSKAKKCPMFGLGMDVDAANVVGLWNETMTNVIVTPHIGGGTIESRIRLFNECAENVIELLGKN